MDWVWSYRVLWSEFLPGVHSESNSNGCEDPESVVNELRSIEPVFSAQVSHGVSEANCENGINSIINWGFSDCGDEGAHQDQDDWDDSGDKGNSPFSDNPFAQLIVWQNPWAPGQGDDEFKSKEPIKGSKETHVLVSFFKSWSIERYAWNVHFASSLDLIYISLLNHLTSNYNTN